MHISITIPIHNEQDNIQLLYKSLIDVLDSLDKDSEIIFVNDCSEDNSGNILDSISETDKRVMVIHLLRNYGQTYAMMAGFDNASGDIIIAMDGDNQNDPSDIPHLLDKINEGYTVVSGWRKDRKDARISRILPSKIANWLISIVSGVKLHDYGCSLKAYRAEVIKGLKLYGEMHRFIPVLTSWRGAKVAEVVVGHRARHSGKSHYGISRAVRVLLDLALIRFMEKHFQHPLHLFGGIGLLSILFAFFTFVSMVYYKFWGGKSFVETPLPTLTIVFTMIGTLSILMGILAEIIMRTYYESQQKKPYSVERITNPN